MGINTPIKRFFIKGSQYCDAKGYIYQRVHCSLVSCRLHPCRRQRGYSAPCPYSDGVRITRDREITYALLTFRCLNGLFTVCNQKTLKQIIIFTASIVTRVHNSRENLKVNAQHLQSNANSVTPCFSIENGGN